MADRLRGLGKDGKATLQTFEDLRKDLRKGLALAGTGVAGLAMLKGGVKEAGNFEAAMTDLRLAFSEVGEGGSVDLAKLNDQMNRLETLSMKLGNALPGNTQMFVEMLAQLRQGGLETEAILVGAGEAVANLAVVSNQLPKDLAKDFAQFGMQFKLKPDEYVKAADLFARIKARTDLGSGELIEGSKYFQLRAGAPLGLKGLEGAETGARLMAAMKRIGLEGSVAGTGTANFFKEITDPKKLKEVKKSFGVDLQFFDKKGGFLGIDNVFHQMEKLRGLSTQKRMTALDKLAGSEGAAVGSAMTDMGLQGWKNINGEFNNTLSLQEQINQKTATYNAKMEALAGTIDNLKATTFTPMLDTLKPIVDLANNVTSSAQEFAKDHQSIAGFGTKLFGLSMVALAVQGGFTAMSTGWRIWKITSAVGGGESSLLDFLRGVRTESDKAGTELGKSAGKAGRFSGALSRISPAVKTTIAIVGIEYALSSVNEIYQAFKDMRQAQAEQEDAASGGLAAYRKLKEAKGGRVDWSTLSGEATAALAALNQNRDLEYGLDPDRFGFLDRTTRDIFMSPYSGMFTTDYDATGYAAEKFKKRAPNLAEADIMSAFIRKIQSGALHLDSEKQGKIFETLQKAFPQSFTEAMTSLRSASEGQRTELMALKESTNNSATALDDVFRPAVNNAAAELWKLKGVPPNLPIVGTGGGPVKNPLLNPPKKLKDYLEPPATPMATGGYIEREGLVHIHSGERVVPAAKVRRDANQAGGSGITVQGGIHLHINVPAGSAAANSPEAFADHALKTITKAVRKQRERR